MRNARDEIILQFSEAKLAMKISPQRQQCESCGDDRNGDERAEPNDAFGLGGVKHIRADKVQGVVGIMYTTWKQDYSKMETFAAEVNGK